MRFFIAILVIVCVLALAATIGTIVVGTRSFEGIVVDKPYEAGLAWDETERHKASLGWRVSLQGTRFSEGTNDLYFTIHDKNGAALTAATASVSVSRPSTVAYDRTFPATPVRNGRYHAVITLPLYGQWDVTVEVARNNDRIAFKNSVFAEQVKK